MSYPFMEWRARIEIPKLPSPFASELFSGNPLHKQTTVEDSPTPHLGATCTHGGQPW